MADLGLTLKNYVKNIVKRAAAQAAKSFLRYLAATFGAPMLIITAAVILVLVTIYAVLPALGIPGSPMRTRDQAVAYYRQVTDKVNPPSRATLYQDLEKSHMLNFGLLYAVDFFANNLSGAHSFQSDALSLGEGLKPVFTYIQRTETIAVSTKDGTDVTKIILTLLSQADTYRGIYTYTYEPYHYVRYTKDAVITVDTWRLKDTRYKEDWTRFNSVVEK